METDELYCLDRVVVAVVLLEALPRVLGSVCVLAWFRHPFEQSVIARLNSQPSLVVFYNRITAVAQ